jgi:hypothetical protein
MESTTRYRQLIFVVVAAVTCVLLSSFAASSAQVVGTVDPHSSELGFESAGAPPDPEGASTSSSPAAIEQDDEFEPDDTIDQASEIKIAVPQQHLFKPLYDEDWMKFRAWDCIEYTIKTFDLNAVNDTQLWLYDANYGELAQDDNSGDELKASKIIWTAPTVGTYYIKARHPKFDGGDQFDYSIRVDQNEYSECYSDLYEPDNTILDARPISVNGQDQQHNFQGPCGGDVDWVKFDVISGTVYVIKTENLNLAAGNDTILGLYELSGEEAITVTVDGYEMVNDDSSNPPASSIKWMAPMSGTYYVKVEPFNACTGRSDLTYRLKVNTSATPPEPPATPHPDGDAFEPDDVAGNAKPIAVNGGPQTGRTIHVAGDEDWVKFWALAGNQYTIQTDDLAPGNDTWLYLYNAQMSLLASNNDIDPPPPPVDPASRIQWTALANGTYYVKVEHDSEETGDPSLSYSLEVTGTATCRDEYEDDNTLVEVQQAQPIIVDGPSQHHNFHNPCATDCEITGYSVDVADWVPFEAVAGVTYTIRTFDLGGYNDTVLELYDESKVLLESNDDARPDDLLVSEIVWVAPDTDTYYIKVSPFDRRIGGCDVDYYLEVTSNEFFLDVNTVGNGSVTQIPEPPYHYGDVVTLTATADPGWTFYQWIGDASGSVTETAITMDANKAVTATFTQDEYVLTIHTVGDGSVSRDPVQSTYLYGEVVVLTATADLGWTFDAWSGALSGNETVKTITMNSDKDVTATFTEDEYVLTVNIVGSGGSVDREPDWPTYRYGDIVTLTAVPDTGWVFVNWSGDASGGSAETTVTMDGHKEVTATFGLGDYVLTVETVGNGTVDVDPPGFSYYYNDVVTLTAIADPGWTFDKWSGNASGSVTETTVTMDANKTVTATFTQDVYTLTVGVVGSGTVDLDPEGPYYYGDVVTLTAVPASIYWYFTGWSGDLSGTDGSDTITMYSHQSVTATFTFQAYVYLPLVVQSWPPNNPPYTPSNLAPANGATDQPISVVLSWSGGDPDGDAVTYDIYLGDTSPPPLAKSDHTTTSYDPDMLEYETEYHWYIVARDSRGAESAPGPEWSFTTVGCECQDTHEPDDSATEGANFPSLVSGQTFNSYVCEEHVDGGVERDYYWFNISSLGQVAVDLAVPDTVNYDLYLWCEGLGGWLNSEKTGQGVDERITYNPASTGGCWVIVKSSGDYDNCNPYGLRATFQ